MTGQLAAFQASDTVANRLNRRGTGLHKGNNLDTERCSFKFPLLLGMRLDEVQPWPRLCGVQRRPVCLCLCLQRGTEACTPPQKVEQMPTIVLSGGIAE